MSEASDPFDKLFGVVLPADKEDSASDDFDIEAECFVCAASEAEEVSEGTAAGEEIDVYCWVSGFLLQHGVHDRCHGVGGILCSVQVAVVLATVFFQTLWGSKRCPLRRLA